MWDLYKHFYIWLTFCTDFYVYETLEIYLVEICKDEWTTVNFQKTIKFSLNPKPPITGSMLNYCIIDSSTKQVTPSRNEG